MSSFGSELCLLAFVVVVFVFGIDFHEFISFL